MASLIAVLYVVATVSFDAVDTRQLVHKSMRTKREARANRQPGWPQDDWRHHLLPADKDVDDAPVVVWLATGHGRTVGLTLGAPPLAR